MESVKTDKYIKTELEEVDAHMEKLGPLKAELLYEQSMFVKKEKINTGKFDNHQMDLEEKSITSEIIIKNEMESEHPIDNNCNGTNNLIFDESEFLKEKLSELINQNKDEKTEIGYTMEEGYNVSINSKCYFEKIKTQNVDEIQIETESEKNNIDNPYIGHLLKSLLLKKNEDKVNMYKCKECSYETKYRQCLQRHKILHKSADEVKVYYCNLCNFKTKHKVSLKNHLVSNRHKSLEDSGCQSNIGEMLDSEPKYSFDSTDEKLQCILCPYETRSKNNFSKHLFTHKNPKECTMYKCNVCSYETKRKGNLTNHLLTHTNIDDIKPFKCKICNFKTKYQSCMSTHVLTHKNSNEVEMFKCNKCSYQAKYKKSLNRHILKTRCAERNLLDLTTLPKKKQNVTKT